MNDSSGFDIDISPEASALRIFQSLNFTPWFALGEFIDNSITSAVKTLIDQNFCSAWVDDLYPNSAASYNVNIEIEFVKDEGSDRSKDRIIIRDNAFGIAEKELSDRALKVGIPPGNVDVGLSRHGVGMKAAAFWFGGEIRITTFPVESPHGLDLVIKVPKDGSVSPVVNVKYIPKSHASKPQYLAALGANGHGTRIEISQLNNPLPVNKVVREKIERYLPSIYRSFIDNLVQAGEELVVVPPGRDIEIGLIPVNIKLVYTGAHNKSNSATMAKDLVYIEPELLRREVWTDTSPPAEPYSYPETWDGDELLWKKEFSIEVLPEGSEGPPKIVKGWYGLLKTLSRETTGFYLHYRGKGISGIDTGMPSSSSDDDDQPHTSSMSSAAVGYRPSKIFGQQGSNRYNGITGSIDMSAFGKSITTDQLQWTPDEEQDFVEKLEAEMRGQQSVGKNQTKGVNHVDFIDMATKFRRRFAQGNSKEEKKSLSEASDDISKHINGKDVPKLGENGYTQDRIKPLMELESLETKDDGAVLVGTFATEFREVGFRISYVSGEGNANLFDIVEGDSDSDNFEIYINEAHSGIQADLTGGEARRLMLRLVLGYAIFEIFNANGKQSFTASEVRSNWGLLLESIARRKLDA